jgi:hypothetical protein
LDPPDGDAAELPGDPAAALVTALRLLQFVAVIFTALALVPSGAHLFELPRKVALSEEQYFVVQSIYRGWSLFGTVIIAAIVANLLLALILFRHGKNFWLSFAAGLVLAGTLAIFFAWTYPANQATNNWTVRPADWETLRRQWELSHAANAVLTFIALCCAALSAVRSADCSNPTSRRAVAPSVPGRWAS